jgi:Flp pilus assembly protein TadD
VIGRAHRTTLASGVARGSLVGCVALGFAAMILTVPAGFASDTASRDARSAARAGNVPRAAQRALRATELEASASAWQLRANLLADLGDAGGADRAFAEAIRRGPREWSIPADWAGVLLRRGDARGARALITRAARLNPLEPRIAALKK